MCTTAILLLAIAGCDSKNKSAAPAGLPKPEQTVANQPGTAHHATTTAIADARSSLKEGNVDEAAAKLAQLQMRRTEFSAQQAQDYRQTLSEAYDRAIEAAQRGDPKGQAAIQLLRAAAPR